MFIKSGAKDQWSTSINFLRKPSLLDRKYVALLTINCKLIALQTIQPTIITIPPLSSMRFTHLWRRCCNIWSKSRKQRFISCGTDAWTLWRFIYSLLHVAAGAAIDWPKTMKNNKNKMPCNIMDNQVDYKVGQSDVAFIFFSFSTWKIVFPSKPIGNEKKRAEPAVQTYFNRSHFVSPLFSDCVIEQLRFHECNQRHPKQRLIHAVDYSICVFGCVAGLFVCPQTAFFFAGRADVGQLVFLLHTILCCLSHRTAVLNYGRRLAGW